MSAHLNIGDFADFQATLSNRDPNFRQLGEQPTFLSERNIDIAGDASAGEASSGGRGSLAAAHGHETLIGERSAVPVADRHLGEGNSRTPQAAQRSHDLQLTARRTAPLGGPLAPLVNNLSLKTAYVTGVDRTEYQDGNAAHSLGRARLSRRGKRATHDGVARLGRRRARRVAGFAPGRSDRRAAGERVPLESDAVPRDDGIRARHRSPSVVPQPARTRGRRSEREHRAQPTVAQRQRVRDSSRRPAPRFAGRSSRCATSATTATRRGESNQLPPDRRRSRVSSASGRCRRARRSRRRSRRGFGRAPISERSTTCCAIRTCGRSRRCRA